MNNYFDSIESNLSCPDALGRTLLEIVDSGALADRIEETLEDVAGGCDDALAKIYSSSILVHSSPRFILQLRRVGARQGSRNSFANRRVLSSSGGPSAAVLSRGSEVWVNEFLISDDTRQLIPSSSFLYDGTVIHDDPDSGILRDLESKDNAWMLRLNYGKIVEQVRYYYADTLEWAFNGAVKGEASSFITLCQVMGASGDRDAIHYLQELTANEVYFVRWAAIQAIGKIDAELARIALVKALDDPEHQVRGAASRALQAMGGPHG